MNYELKNTNPASVVTSGTDTIVTVGFTTGVVGCPYNMIVGDTLTTTIPNSGAMTRDQIDAAVMAEVQDFIAEKYPNT